MGTGEKSVVVNHVVKKVIMDNQKQMCRWVRMAKTWQRECDGGIPVTMLVIHLNTLKVKYTQILSKFKYIKVHWNIP
jgi:hypothetical protein